ncbi:homospermidine biosynthesis protein [Anaeromyxobacter paludicola]|uniref:Deoxyhypusine synthase n=1 Tax=Anaeromyxobacter paludicola TaxID=2918171 RepID=A0ABN6N4Y2_9BACT|nr:deoxyhypusine synthase [Anaeromyxobacter paludicola]BDG07012.1 deoxyhypusine synthase [Anaeromyxobacter paludicola]
MAQPTPKQLRKRYLSRPPVEPMKLSPGMTVEELVDVYRKAGAFNGGRLAEACDLFGRMIDSGATIALTVTGAMTPAGMGGAIQAMIEAGFVDLIISTGANIYHDLHFALKLPVVQGHFNVDDKELYRAGVERIYDIFITEDSLLDTDAFVREALEKAPADLQGNISTPQLHRYLADVAWKNAPLPEKSFLCTAAKYDVPVFTSSPGDSSIGMNVAAMKLRGGKTTVDPDLDVLLSTSIVYDADKNGVVILGGGSPKNFYLQTQPTLWQILDLNRGGHEFVLQISTDSPQWGGLSGATPSEAISWGKVQAEMIKNHVVLYADSTLAAPLVFAYALATRKKRKPKRLYARLPELFGALQKAHLKKHPGAGALSEMKSAGKTKKK